MKWSPEDAAVLMEAAGDGPSHTSWQRVATKAVELVAARGGPPTDNQIAGAFAVLATREDASRAGAFAIRATRERLTALSARVAVLEAELATLSETYKRTYKRAFAAEEYVDALRDGDRAALEQLAHAFGWKDGGPGWQAAIDEVKRIAVLKPSGQVAEDELLLRSYIGAFTERPDIGAPLQRAALSRLAADAQTLQNLRAAHWKCQCGRPVTLAAVIDAEKENPT